MNIKLIGQQILVLITVCLLMACDRQENAGEIQAADDKSAMEENTPAVPLYDNLGEHHYAISTDLPQVQAYFNQGMRLYYAFNHAEAIRAFRVAQELDPQCAMCWWGEALAWGPNINLPMDEPSGRAAYAAMQEALARREHGNEREQVLIDALEVRYAKEPPEDRAHLDRAYSEAMAGVAAAYPDDQDIQVLFAESLMDLRPWDYWEDDGTPKPGIAEALTRLEAVIGENPNHPGACHFFIHAVEKLYPERAVDCAERLADLMPGAGHLVHMPGHIYIRVGRYLDAVKANQHAIHADETYIRDQNPAMGMYTAGYYPHNYDFLAFATMMLGQSQASIEAAEKVANLLPRELLGQPGMDFLQHWSIRPLLVRTRFARWQEILDTPSPDASLSHATAMWHYARGRAFAASGDLEAAVTELEKLRNIVNSEVVTGIHMEFNESADLLAVADKVLAGWIDTAAKRYDEAERNLREAVKKEDALLYGEPPEWTVPVRQDLGPALLVAGRYEKAEQAFREDLERFPKNGWSLYGLASALRAQGHEDEAETVQEAFDKAWENADIESAVAFGQE
ncbi:tetratricopeptide repeat protein [Methylophaga sp. OBS4]|uniref:tetratricopeptide repeat protein n=1 Tax=Methylophaga sp. OBS4 TaxID=2991935 RepID=UPI00225B1BFD|nr:tetratricopeptide repeat protein [Methylophaga sp. OBS4]MCX4187040.1 tetratricopeptide repeat protein [Methylophaga sp. OBS4]